jgi:hypothetical protein
MTATAAPTLSELSEDQLRDLYEAVSYDDQAARIVVAELARRDRNDTARDAALHARRHDPAVAEWSDAAIAQFTQAEAACEGKLVSRTSKITDAFSLWSGPEWLARVNASEELRNFWDDHPRIPTATEWREHGDADIPPEDTRQGEDTTMEPAATTQTAYGARMDALQAEADRRAEKMQREANGTVAVCGSAALARPRVDGAEVLTWTRQFLDHHVVWPSPATLTMVTLWTAQAHFRDEDFLPVWQYAPKLAFLSRKPGGGKSFAQRIVSKLVPDGKILIEPSEPAVARKLGRQHQTVFLDEADILFGTGKRKSAIRSIINSSYEPDGEWSRASGSGETTSDMPVFGQLGFAGLDVLRTGTGENLNALLDRCLFAFMRKAPEGHRAPRFDDGPRMVAAKLGERLGLWAAQEIRGGIARVIPDLPGGLGNRPAGLWEPLIACADAAGGPWPDDAREACIELESTGGLPGQDEDDRTMLGDYFAALGRGRPAASADADPYAAADYDNCTEEEE